MRQTLYQALLGDEFEILPTQIRALHNNVRKAAGRADFTRGKSPLARLICAISRVPVTGQDVVIETRFDPIDEGERWTRNFSGRSFITELTIARSDTPGILYEQFGPLKFRVKVIAHSAGVDLIPDGVSAWGIPLPRLFCPEAVGLERVRDNRYCFDVTVRVPLAGEVLSYQGWLAPVRD